MGWVRLGLVGVDGSTVDLDVNVRSNSVEFRVWNKTVGTMERHTLTSWLSCPEGGIVAGDVEIRLTRWGVVAAVRGLAEPTIVAPPAYDALSRALNNDRSGVEVSGAGWPRDAGRAP